jgi:arsenate reductase
MAKPKVLFLCRWNRARSQIAQAFLVQAAGDRFDVFSAGLGADPIHPLTIQVMAERGIDLSGHSAKDVREYLGKVNFAYIITVCDATEPDCPTFPGVMSTRLNWPFPDPLEVQGTDEERLTEFRAVRDAIEARILAWLDELTRAPAASPTPDR